MKYLVLKNKKKIKKQKKIKLITILVILLIIFYLISNNLSNYLLVYSKAIIEKNIKNSINNSITTNIMKKINTDNLIIIKKENNIINEITYNTYLLSIYSNEILYNYKYYYKEKEYIKIPLGKILNNNFLSNLGPNIKVGIKNIDNISISPNIEIKDFGINNYAITLYINIIINSQIVLPINNKNIKIESKIPISYKIINGEVPKYYLK